MLANENSLRGAGTPRSGDASFSRQATRRFRPLLRPTDSKWQKDADIEQGAAGLKDTSRWKVLILAFQTLGVVYGDIGTSPLYVFAGVFNGDVPVTTENILGAASLIIWTITAIPVLKYALIVLRADDNGQGGSFALYAQLRRQGLPDPDAAADKDPNASGRSSHLTGTTPPRVMDWRQRFIQARSTQLILMLAVVFGVGLIMGDGVLTPAISVVSAIEGLQLGIPSITRGTIIGVAVAILAVLFLIQQFGTATVGYSFAPVVALFFIFNSVIGIYNIAKYSPSIFKVLAPTYWFRYFLNNKGGAWRSLSGVLLSITGAEALFADLGHFNRQSIQLGMLCIVYPALLLTYLGQAAYLTQHPENVSSTFYVSMPNKGVFWAMLVVATGAAIVASQALISASYQIVSQAIRLSFFPRFRITHTSEKHTGQIYIAIINYVLMALTIIVVIAFRTSARIGLAYGLAVNMDLVLTTCFLALVMLTVWRKHWVFPVLFFVVFATIETTFLSSAVLKVPKGGWFSLMMAGIYGYVMLLWFWGSNRKRQIFKDTRKQLAQFVKVKRTVHTDGNADDSVMLVSRPTQQLHRLPGVGLFYDNSIQGVPHPLVALVDTFPTLPRVVVFMTVRFVPVPEVLPLERYLVEQLGAPGFYHVIARYGYTQRVQQSEDEVMQINKHILALLYRTLRFKMQHDDSLRGVVQAHPLSPAAQALVEGALGDMHGSLTDSTHPDNVNTLSNNSISVGGMSLSIHGLSTRATRTASRLAGARPSIMNVAWGTDGVDEDHGTPVAAGAVPEDRTAHGPPAEASVQASVYSTLTSSKSQKARRSAVLAFEREMQQFSDQVATVLAERKRKEPSPAGSARLDVLRTLAREIGLVAVAAQDGCLCHVVGRAHIPLSRTKNPFRKYVMELPFAFMSRNTEQDIATTFQIDERKLVEVGLRYYL